MNKIPNIILPAPATLDGMKVTIYPSFDGFVTFSRKDKLLHDTFPRDMVMPSQKIVFDEFPDRPVRLDKVRYCWIPA